MLTKGSIEWPQLDPRASTAWLWGPRSDLFWIAGGGSLLFSLFAVPLTVASPASAQGIVNVFLHLGAVCNLPHYAITYQLIVRERQKAPSSYFWLLATTPLAIGAVVAAVLWPPLVGLLVRSYLTWSIYHYAAQHFGIASMYQARAKRPLVPLEKRLVQVGFVAISLHLALLLNMKGGLGDEAVFGVSGAVTKSWPLLPSSVHPLAIAMVALGVSVYAAAEVLHRKRTGEAMTSAARLLFATNFVWFVVPFLRPPGHAGWMPGSVMVWVLFALPFFHCAQYLGVCGWRARTTGPIKPIYYFMGLVVLGLALFEGIWRVIASVSPLPADRSLLLVPAVLNIHHFFLDGLMWKARRRPAAAQGQAVEAAPALKRAA